MLQSLSLDLMYWSRCQARVQAFVGSLFLASKDLAPREPGPDLLKRADVLLVGKQYTPAIALYTSALKADIRAAEFPRHQVVLPSSVAPAQRPTSVGGASPPPPIQTKGTIAGNTEILQEGKSDRAIFGTQTLPPPPLPLPSSLRHLPYCTRRSVRTCRGPSFSVAGPHAPDFAFQLHKGPSSHPLRPEEC